MRAICLLGLILTTGSGCRTLPPDPACSTPCPPAQASCPPTGSTQVEVQGGPETITVQAPKTKFIVETPPGASFQAPTSPSGAAFQIPGAGFQAPVVPSTGYTAGFGGLPMGGQVRERTGFGLAFDSIKIPFPVIRPIAVPRPSEVTFQVPPQQFSGGFAGAGFVTPVMPMGNVGFMAQPTGVSMGTAMVPQPAVGFGQMQVQGQLTVQQIAVMQQMAAQGLLTPQQLTILQAALAAQSTGGFQGGTSAGFQGGSNQPALQDRLKAAEKQLRELQEQCEKEKSPTAPAPAPKNK